VILGCVLNEDSENEIILNLLILDTHIKGN